jgi:hypothetical protein
MAVISTANPSIDPLYVIIMKGYSEIAVTRNLHAMKLIILKDNSLEQAVLQPRYKFPTEKGETTILN